MEITIKYHFYGQEKIVEWQTKKIETLKKSYNVKFLNI